MTKIVVLDGHTLNPGDLSWDELKNLGDLTVYDRTSAVDLLKRAEAADAVIVNKQKLGKETLAALPGLKYIGVSATGVNNVDLEAARKQEICVTNVKGYSTQSVAQHTFGLILALANRIETHSQSVHKGDWVNATDWSYSLSPLVEIAGKTLGLIGLGSIGEAVARVGIAFGMNVIAYRKNQSKGFPEGVQPAELEELFRKSDIVSLHCPLTPETAGIIDARSLAWMKKNAFLINTGRGPLIMEKDLAEALHKGTIAGAGLDVLSDEPPKADNPLLGAPNCVITPHNAWASLEARKRCMSQVVANLKSFLEGEVKNRVV